MMLKALTISQPYATLIAEGFKWVENRTWSTPYRGWLAIHAGCGTQYLSRREQEQFNYPTRKVIAFARLVAVAHLPSVHGALCPQEMLDAGISADDLVKHKYAEGPYCWILKDVVKLDEPEPIAGKQGLWNFKIPARLHSLMLQLPHAQT